MSSELKTIEPNAILSSYDGIEATEAADVLARVTATFNREHDKARGASLTMGRILVTVRTSGLAYAASHEMADRGEWNTVYQGRQSDFSEWYSTTLGITSSMARKLQDLAQWDAAIRSGLYKRVNVDSTPVVESHSRHLGPVFTKTYDAARQNGRTDSEATVEGHRSMLQVWTAALSEGKRRIAALPAGKQSGAPRITAADVGHAREAISPAVEREPADVTLEAYNAFAHDVGALAESLAAADSSVAFLGRMIEGEMVEPTEALYVSLGSLIERANVVSDNRHEDGESTEAEIAAAN